MIPFAISTNVVVNSIGKENEHDSNPSWPAILILQTITEFVDELSSSRCYCFDFQNTFYEQLKMCFGRS